jgi:nitroreductase
LIAKPYQKSEKSIFHLEGFMDIIQAIKSRHSVRAFLEKPVDEQIISKILDAARFAPSGKNIQPWQVSVVTGLSKQRLGNNILDARARGVPDNPDYQYYPLQTPGEYKERSIACGMALYGALHIDRKDKEARLIQWNKNYHFFGAPVGLIISLEKILEKGSWMDLGMFIQNIMIAAEAFDLGTCPQASIAEHPDIVRSTLGLPDTHAIACGIALGYPDDSHPVNQYRTAREPIEKFTQWFR